MVFDFGVMVEFGLVGFGWGLVVVRGLEVVFASSRSRRSEGAFFRGFLTGGGVWDCAL